MYIAFCVTSSHVTSSYMVKFIREGGYLCQSLQMNTLEYLANVQKQTFRYQYPSVYFVHIGSIQVVLDTIGAQEPRNSLQVFYYGQTYSYMMSLSSRYYVGKTPKQTIAICYNFLYLIWMCQNYIGTTLT